MPGTKIVDKQIRLRELGKVYSELKGKDEKKKRSKKKKKDRERKKVLAKDVNHDDFTSTTTSKPNGKLKNKTRGSTGSNVTGSLDLSDMK